MSPFSRGEIFTRARVWLALVSLRKNGDFLWSTGIHLGLLIPALVTTVKPRLRTPHYYGQFAVSLGKQSAYIFT